jgi:hypothetical protein
LLCAACWQALYGNMPRVRTPAIYWQATQRRVLTMEWIEGVKLTNKVRRRGGGSTAPCSAVPLTRDGLGRQGTSAELQPELVTDAVSEQVLMSCSLGVAHTMLPLLLLLLPLLLQPAMDEAGLDIVDFVDVGIEVRPGRGCSTDQLRGMHAFGSC